MHTARWPEEDGLDGQRVAVVGTGAGAQRVAGKRGLGGAHTAYCRCPRGPTGRGRRLKIATGAGSTPVGGTALTCGNAA